MDSPAYIQRLADNLGAQLAENGLVTEVNWEPVVGTKMFRFYVVSDGFANMIHSERQSLVWRINAVTDDHVTVGLLHWDGEQLRFAGDSSKVAVDQGRSTLSRAIHAIRAQVENCNPEQPSLLEDVRQVFPVAEGDGSLLR